MSQDYETAKNTLATIKQWKAEHRALLMQQIATLPARQMWLSAKDVDSAAEAFDENINELCWQSKREALRAVQEHETRERLEHELSESPYRYGSRAHA